MRKNQFVAIEFHRETLFGWTPSVIGVYQSEDFAMKKARERNETTNAKTCVMKVMGCFESKEKEPVMRLMFERERLIS